MNVLIKYLSLEAIENTVTCLNYQINKVVFFGRQLVINEESRNIKHFLQNYCGIKDIQFYSVDNKDYEDISNIIKDKITTGDQCFFDFTGDEGIFEAVAFKMANELDIPVHTYDIWHQRTVVIRKNNKDLDISCCQRIENVKLTIKSYIEMLGGKIKPCNKTEFKKDINYDLLEIRKRYFESWTTFATLLAHVGNIDDLSFCCADLNKILRTENINIAKKQIFTIINDLKNIGIFNYVHIDKDNNSFNLKAKDWSSFNLITDAGAIFEQITYLAELKKDKVDECEMGVAFYWNAFKTYVTDVNNEIDVLSLKDYNLTFISCKDTDTIKIKFLYELQAVARGFGGNYVKMKLVTTAKPNDNITQRAKELGIIVEYQHF